MSNLRITGTGCRRPIRQAWRCALASVAACVLVWVGCSRNNPFADTDNARAVITEHTLASGDTLDVFTTYGIDVDVAVKELVHSVTVHAPGNRLWSAGDSVITKARLWDAPFHFAFSFHDTGTAYVVIQTERANGASAIDTLTLFVRSPLHQDTVRAVLGDSVTLRTPPVGDVTTYFWSFGAGTVYPSPRCSLRVALSTPILSGRGALWVSDGTVASPAGTFAFALRDTVKPGIVCVNEGYAGEDTIYTSDSVFTLKVRITDRGDQWVDSASVNDEAFDRKDNRVYYKLCDNMFRHGPADPLLLSVYALDHFGNGNEATRDLWVIYNDTAPRGVAAEIVVESPSVDTLVTAADRFALFGTLINHSLNPVDVTLSLLVNGTAFAPSQQVASDTAWWTWTVPLDTGLTSIQIRAVNNANAGVIDLVERTIRRVPLLPDTVAPRILRVTVDGASAQNVYTDHSSVVVGVEALDEQSFVDSLTIGGVLVQPESPGSRFYYDTVSLAHVASGNEITIRAVDTSGNDSVRTLLICRNRKPVVQDRPASRYIESQSAYADTIAAFDPDGDSVVYSRWTGPAALAVSSDGRLSWIPDSADTDAHQVTIRVWDGYQPVFETFTLYVTLRGHLPPTPVRFATREQDFPQYLEAGRDTLRITLHAAAGAGIRPFLFTSWLFKGATTLLPRGRDSVLVWAPGAADTGFARLMVTVRDQFPSEDTLSPRILVVPTNRPCALELHHRSDTLPNGALNLNGKRGADTLTYRIVDPDNPDVESYSVTIHQWRTQMTNHMDSARVDSFSVVMDPAVFDGYDTVTVTIIDRAGHTSTIKTTLYYGMPPYAPQPLSPVDLGAVAGLSPTLTWQSTDPDGDSLWCEVYLGVNSQNLPRAGTTTAASYAAAALQAGATYYWRVVVHDWKSRTTGPVWEFDTP